MLLPFYICKLNVELQKNGFLLQRLNLICNIFFAIYQEKNSENVTKL